MRCLLLAVCCVIIALTGVSALVTASIVSYPLYQGNIEHLRDPHTDHKLYFVPLGKGFAYQGPSYWRFVHIEYWPDKTPPWRIWDFNAQDVEDIREIFERHHEIKMQPTEKRIFIDHFYFDDNKFEEHIKYDSQIAGVDV